MTPSEDAEYESYPDQEPYTETDRYENPKEDFKTIASRLQNLLDTEQTYRVADLGCANGELLYLLNKTFPHWELHGYDRTKAFLETARGVDGLSDVQFHHRDLFEVEETFDVVLSSLVLLLFQDVEPPLRKMLSLTRSGGYLLGTGLFNEHDIEVHVEYRDFSSPETADDWRTDYNRHPRSTIREQFGDQIQSIQFEDMPFDVELEKDPNNPIRVWTIEDADGNHILTNGAGQILNQTLMTIRK